MSAEAPPGYKKTEVGVIPDGWEVKTIGSLLSETRLGGNYPNRQKETGNPLIKMTNIGRGNISLGKLEYISDGIQPDEEDRLRFGDVLFNTRNTLELVGKVAIWRDELPRAYYNSNLMRLTFKREEIASDFFANYILNSSGCISRLAALATGTTSVAAIYTRDLLRMPIPIPPLPEQRTIAAALSDVDALIAALDKLIAKKRAVKTAAMQRLLTGRQRLPGFDGEWETRRLGDCTEINSGGTPPSSVSEYYDGNIPWVSITDMTKRGKYIVSTDRNLTEKGLANSAARMFPNGTVLYAMYASIGECSIAGVDLCSSQAILGIRPDKQLDNSYLYFLLTSKKEEVKTLGQQGTQANLNAGMVKDFEIPLPPIEEQRAIATVLSDMDAEISVLEARRDKTRRIKRAMMGELLTGRTRLA